jgi:protein involved in polysaccharide export with SLBB domain
MRFPSTHNRTFGSRSAAAKLLVGMFLVAGCSHASASAQSQQATPLPTMQPMATRADLTALADRLERGTTAERVRAAALRVRLRDGDFQAGDRIALQIEGNVSLYDTAAVAAGSKIDLKDIGEIPLNGVLRSELQDHMSKQIARYIRDARVKATPLVRVSVLGPVGKPGFYFMPSDIPVTEAIMRAGGPAGTADLRKTAIRRGTEELYDSRNTQTALDEGRTLDQLSLRDGDSIEVGEKSTRSWQQIAGILSLATSLLIAIKYGFSRR